ncbi:MAG: hypothetical protein K6V97_06710 [Actinomycetia bacterium]|nr:hypothetical protein [Actinomycetes bacterium]
MTSKGKYRVQRSQSTGKPEHFGHGMNASSLLIARLINTLVTDAGPAAIQAVYKPITPADITFFAI